MKKRRDIFQAIADPTRRAIIMLLAAQSMTAGSIAQEFNAARPTISKHIQILTECELVESRKEGREIHYQIKAEKMDEIDAWIQKFRKIWETRFNQLDEVLLNMKNQKNEK